jgi:NAD(P)-dependent dehydrogenase (short-subunit alcohol dehydrogenase family)
MNDTHSKVWLITGCSSGFGRILAEMALARGDRVIATARKIEPLADLGAGSAGQLLTLALDVTDPASIAAVMAQAEAAFGRVDVLVNNAGFGLVGAVEELQPNEYRPMFETNLFGLIEVTRGALPLMRRHGGARIVNLSSVGGFTGRQGFGLYNASKFAVEGLSEALAEEVAPFGIKVIIVEPGPFEPRSSVVRLPWATRASPPTRQRAARRATSAPPTMGSSSATRARAWRC